MSAAGPPQGATRPGERRAAREGSTLIALPRGPVMLGVEGVQLSADDREAPRRIRSSAA